MDVVRIEIYKINKVYENGVCTGVSSFSIRETIKKNQIRLLLMGQQEVYTLLKRHSNKWLSSKELAEKLKISLGSVTVSLQKLRRGDLISFKLRGNATNPLAGRKSYVYKFRK